MATLGRPKKTGLDFFPEVVTPDDDFKYIETRYPHGYKVVRKLWGRIYRNGYFCEWNERTLYTFSNEINISPEIINEILDECFKIDLFSKEMLTKHSILTSSGVQWRWKLISIASKRLITEVDPKYNLLTKKGKKKGGNKEESAIPSGEKSLSSGGKSELEIPKKDSSVEKSLSSGGKSISSGFNIAEKQQSKTFKSNTINSITLGEKNIGDEEEEFLGEKKEEIGPAKKIWDACVRVWLDFSIEKFGDEPSFYAKKGEKKGPNPAKLKSILDKLQDRAFKRHIPWTIEHATKTLRWFLDLAYADPWLKKTFLLKNIEQKYDAIILQMIEIAQKNKDEKPPVQDKDIDFLYDTYKDSRLTMKMLSEKHYDHIQQKVDLPISEELFLQARKFRVKALEGTNDAGLLRLLRSYLDNAQNEDIAKDEANVLTIAKKMRVVDYFSQRASHGAEKWL